MAARHHTVPQFCLRNFADESGQVVLVDRDEPTRTHRTSVHNAASEAGFYRIEAEDLERPEDRARFDPESIEAALSGLEGEMAPAVKTLVDGRFDEFTDDTWYRMIQFTAIQAVRGHRWRNDFTALATHAFRMEFFENLDLERTATTLANQGKPHDPEAVARYLSELAEGQFPRILPPQAIMVQASLKMALGDPDSDELGLIRYLADKKPELILPRQCTVLTSDEPVVWWSPGGAPVGYASARVVWVPLSPKLILQFRDPTLDLTAHGLPEHSQRSGHDELAAFVNRLVAAQAERWVIHHPNDLPLADIDLPPREIWGDVLVDVREDGNIRRALYIHRRLQPDAQDRT